MKKPSKETNLKELCKIAIENGASRAKIIDSGMVVVDERVHLKCRYPPCVHYGKNLLCPPYTPSAKNFKGCLARYKHAIIVQIDVPIMAEISNHIRNGGAKLTELRKAENLFIRREDWKRLHAIVSAVERESFKKGYYFSLGLGAGNCKLCKTCNPKLPCKKPWEARPSMEAVGIDVYKTAQNSGLEFKWNTMEYMTLNGLILID